VDHSRFDALTRTAAKASSRRALLGTAISAALAGFIGQRAEAAADRGPGAICRKNGDCATGVCGLKDRTGRQRCQCVDVSDCPGSDSSCPAAVCSNGICGWEPVAAETDPTLSFTSGATDQPNYCSVTINASGFAGCTTVTGILNGVSIDIPFNLGEKQVPIDKSGSGSLTVDPISNGDVIFFTTPTGGTGAFGVSC
jgi:hypothetical protein